jgi:hypothetical protein
VKSTSIYHLLLDLRAYPGTINCYTFGEFLHLSITTNEEEVRNYLQEKGHAEIEFKAIEPTVEDCFIRLLKQQDERNSNKDK